MRANLITLVFILLGCSLTAQFHSFLSDFSAFKDKNRVILNWTVSKGNSCLGIGILRSSDGINFVNIGQVEGICGSSESSTPYSFIDENPVKNKTNYYVLELGFSGKSNPPIEVKYFNLEKGYLVTPNPIRELGQVHFNNPNNDIYTIFLYDSQGNVVKQSETNDEEFVIDAESIERNSTINSNIYLFKIRNKQGNLSISGKMIVVKD